MNRKCERTLNDNNEKKKHFLLFLLLLLFCSVACLCVQCRNVPADFFLCIVCAGLHCQTTVAVAVTI